MPKNRRRNQQRGAKSIAVRTKNKVGGRKSDVSATKLTNDEIEKMLNTCRKRDRNKLRQTLFNRGLVDTAG